MTYEVIILGHLHMPLYFIGTFTEYSQFATNKKESVLANSLIFSGEGGIRTPGPVTVNGFQDRRDRPLCHLSNADAKIE